MPVSRAGPVAAAVLLAVLMATPLAAQTMPAGAGPAGSADTSDQTTAQQAPPGTAAPDSAGSDLAGPPGPAAPASSFPAEGPTATTRTGPTGGQDPAVSPGQAILTVDQEALYRQSRWGRRAQMELAAESRQVAADNDRAFSALVADENALTAARATLSPEEFRRRAAAFDERVTAVRQERDRARDALAARAERDRALFFQAAAPMLGQIMKQRGALVVLDQRMILISDERIDVTDATIAAVDAELGDGSALVAASRATDGQDAADQPGPAGSADNGAPGQADASDGPLEPAPRPDPDDASLAVPDDLQDGPANPAASPASSGAAGQGAGEGVGQAAGQGRGQAAGEGARP